MNQNRLHEILNSIENVAIGVLGELCLDAYWNLDPRSAEISLETGKPVRRVASHHYSLGAAANVVANLAALRVGAIKVFGVVGKDLFANEILRQLGDLNADCSGIVVQESGWFSTVYAKPYAGDDEQERFDFGTANQISAETEAALLANLEAALGGLDVLIVNQQLPQGYHSPAVLERINQFAERRGVCPVIVDSRDKSEQFGKVIFKINAIEAAAHCGEQRDVKRAIPLDDLKKYAAGIYESTGKAVFITRGERGLIAYDGKNFSDVPGIQSLKRTDPVGAGDTSAAAIAASMAAGATVEECARIGAFATSVTVQKLKQTGTASPEEIKAVGASPDYVFRPELSENTRHAQYLDGSQIEIIVPEITRGKIAHAVFDHDGTISTLREGWEKIMEPVMVQAILGDYCEHATEEEYLKVTGRALDFVDKSTGIQTILQMQGLVEMVREFGFVPESKILDARGYKDIYNAALMELIDQRIETVKRGELGVEDWTVKGAVSLLRTLHDKGIKLYLASGTDEQDVINEAKILGYADLFEDRIFGAIGDVSKYSKKMVLDRIIRDNNLSGAELVTFGDGPVELRETNRRGGIAVGVASDEVRRYGMNLEKRTRLVRAGADIIVPDFSQREMLLEYLKVI